MTEKTVLSPQIRRGIESWNTADMLMYDHFNRTFWDKVRHYGPTFTQDLKLFRELNRKVTAECADLTVGFPIVLPSISCNYLRKLEMENHKVIRTMIKHRLNITRDKYGFPFKEVDWKKGEEFNVIVLLPTNKWDKKLRPHQHSYHIGIIVHTLIGLINW